MAELDDKKKRRSPTFIPNETNEQKIIRLYGKEIICPICKKTFISTPNPRNHTGYRTYCSNECYYNHARAHEPSKELLEELYINQQLPEREVGEKVKRSVGTIHRLLIQNNIPVRSRSQSVRLAMKMGRFHTITGKNSPSYKGDNYRYIDKHGYVRVRLPDDYPYRPHGKSKICSIQEHILVWELANGQRLPDGWAIHHLNGIKDDNRIKNLLAVSSNSEHKNKENRLWKTRLRYIQTLEKRIIQLEADVTLLRSSLEKNQSIFYLGDNPDGR